MFLHICDSRWIYVGYSWIKPCRIWIFNPKSPWSQYELIYAGNQDGWNFNVLTWWIWDILWDILHVCCGSWFPSQKHTQDWQLSHLSSNSTLTQAPDLLLPDVGDEKSLLNTDPKRSGWWLNPTPLKNVTSSVGKCWQYYPQYMEKKNHVPVTTNQLYKMRLWVWRIQSPSKDI